MGLHTCLVIRINFKVLLSWFMQMFSAFEVLTVIEYKSKEVSILPRYFHTSYTQC